MKNKISFKRKEPPNTGKVIIYNIDYWSSKYHVTMLFKRCVIICIGIHVKYRYLRVRIYRLMFVLDYLYVDVHRLLLCTCRLTTSMSMYFVFLWRLQRSSILYCLGSHCFTNEYNSMNNLVCPNQEEEKTVLLVMMLSRYTLLKE